MTIDNEVGLAFISLSGVARSLAGKSRALTASGRASSSSSSINDYGKTIVDRIESLQFYKLFCWPSGQIQNRVSEVRGSKDRY